MHGIYDLASAGKLDEAAEVFGRVRKISDAIYEKAPLMQHWVVEKEVLKARGLFKSAAVRPPFQPIKQ